MGRGDDLEPRRRDDGRGHAVARGLRDPPFAAAAAAPFLVDGASFALAALLVLGLRPTFRAPRPDGPRPTIRADVAEGLRWLAGHSLLGTLAITLGVMNLLEAATTAVLVLYALEVLGLSSGGHGVLLAAGALGALVGSVIAPRVSARLGPGRLLVAAVLATGLATLVPALVANAVAVGVALAVVGLSGVAWNVVTVSLRQAVVPDRLLGRVNSVYRLLGWGTMPVGALVGGALAGAPTRTRLTPPGPRPRIREPGGSGCPAGARRRGWGRWRCSSSGRRWTSGS